MAKLDLQKALQFLNYIGFDEKTIEGLPDETFLDESKKIFDSKYHTAQSFFESQDYKNKVGEWNGSLTIKLIKLAQKFGVEIPGKYREKMEPEKAFEGALTTLQEQENAVKLDLEEKAKKSVDDNYKVLETKYQTIEKDYKNLENVNKELKTTAETDKANYVNQLKTEKLSFREKDLHSKYNWGTDDELRRMGFVTYMDGKYKNELDESDNLIPIDRKTGEKIPNPDKSKAFMDVDTLWQIEGIKMGVYKTNKDGGKPAPQNFRTPQPANGNGAPLIPQPNQRPIALNTDPNFGK